MRQGPRLPIFIECMLPSMLQAPLAAAGASEAGSGPNAQGQAVQINSAKGPVGPEEDEEDKEGDDEEEAGGGEEGGEEGGDDEDEGDGKTVPQKAKSKSKGAHSFAF